MPKRLQAQRQRQERIAVLAEYLPSLLFLIVATGIGVALMLVGRFLPDVLILKSSRRTNAASRLSRTRA